MKALLLQRPDSARARPSTLLEDDDSYGKLFHENTSLNTYFIITTRGRAIQDRLKQIKKYEASECSDIKFYVLYHAACIKTNSLYPNSQSIESILDPKLSEPNIDISIYNDYNFKDVCKHNRIKVAEWFCEMKPNRYSIIIDNNKINYTIKRESF